MSCEELSAPRTTAEVLLLDSSIQEGMRSVFQELENLYDGIACRTSYGREAIGPTLVTPSGVCIEVSRVILPLINFNDFRSTDEFLRNDKKRRSSEEYMLFIFQMQELHNPDFQLKPITVKGRDITDNGSYIDILVTDPSDPKPVWSMNLGPIAREDWVAYDAYCESLKSWTDRSRLRIAKKAAGGERHSFRGEPAEPLKVACERVGAVL